MPTPQIKVLPDPEAVAREAAERIIEVAGQAVQHSGAFSIVLSGGSTPRPLYEHLATPAMLGQIEWERAQVYFSDERAVGPDHPDSNYRMAHEVLLGPAGVPASRTHRIRGEIDPNEAAIEYGRLLRDRFGEDGGPDIILLGMGEDGHTASLFAHSPALGEARHRCVASYVERLAAWRITLTPRMLNAGMNVLVLITGAAKAARVAEALEGEPDPQRLPIQLIDPIPPGKLTWLLDTAAAGMDSE